MVLIEDLHWLDDTSAELLHLMLNARGQCRYLVLVNFRPEFAADWMRHAWYQQLPLMPLEQNASAELLANLLGDDPGISKLTKLIYERTEGNPFFTEEIAQSLIESEHLQGKPGAYRVVTPVDQLDVPPTVQAVLAARIDRLLENENAFCSSHPSSARNSPGHCWQRFLKFQPKR